VLRVLLGLADEEVVAPSARVRLPHRIRRQADLYGSQLNAGILRLTAS
jgi:hypothetical protein